MQKRCGRFYLDSTKASQFIESLEVIVLVVEEQTDEVMM